MSRRNVAGHQFMKPFLVLLHGGEEPRSLGWIQAIAVDKCPESLEFVAAPVVGDGGPGPERGPQAGRAGDVPEARAGAGEVEVDERNSSAVPKNDVVEVGVVVADELAREGSGR